MSVIASRFLLAAVLLPVFVSAQSLPPPSRTMYKCQAKGTTTYSESPCPGATRLEIEPSRGVSKLSGKERIGQDVFYERQREAMAEAWRPVTGMDAKELAVYSRRAQLAPAARNECRQLDQSMPEAELEERRVAPAQLREVQQRLFLLRQRSRELRC